MTLNFSGRHYPSDIIMQALRYYLAYKLSYREIEEMFAERNIHFDHSTLNRWVITYAPQLEAVFRNKQQKIKAKRYHRKPLGQDDIAELIPYHYHKTHKLMDFYLRLL